jgi:hypothetical protein
MIFEIKILILLFHFVVSIENDFKIEINEMTEDMKDFVLGKALSVIGQKMNYNQIAEKLTTGMNHEFGSKWICLVGPIGLVSQFEAEVGSKIWFSYESTQIILFKPLRSTDIDLIKDARKSFPKYKILKNEMAESMKEHAVTLTSVALNKFDDFKSIAANISSSFKILYGHTWNCYVSRKYIDYATEYIPNTFISFEIEEIQITMFQIFKPNLIVKINSKFSKFLS